MVPSHLIPSLASAADTAIGQALASGATQAGQQAPKTEPAFVAAVVLQGVGDIAAAWRPILQPAGLSVRLQGVFCHQTPQVTFTDRTGQSRQCELADLLVLVEDHVTGSQRRWAALVQAKMAAASGGQRLSRPGDLVQHELLSTWPRFSMPSGYASHGRDLASCAHPGQLLDCGRYGLIDPNCGPAWYQQAPSLTLVSAGSELGSFVAQMTESGQTGWGCEATGVADDWSFTVDELATKTAAMMFTHSPSLSGTHQRGMTVPAFSVAGEGMPQAAVFPAGGGQAPGGGAGLDAPGPGISLLKVEIIEAAG